MTHKHLITLLDWEPEEVRKVLEQAIILKQAAKEGALPRPLVGRTLALIFEKSSMRTRVSFEVAMFQLGGSTLYLSKQDVNLGQREPIRDGARVLDRYVDVIAARVYEHKTVEELATYSSIPVINALSNEAHPCQALADILTVLEHFGRTEGVNVTFVGDPNNVARSLAIACAYTGANFRIAAPEGYAFDDEFVQCITVCADKMGASFRAVTDPEEAVTGAQVIYTDVWISMGQEQEADRRRRDLAAYTVDDELLAVAGPDARVMHCLPAHRDEEITDSVIEGPQSIVFDQAENRLHAQRALLYLLLQKPF